MTPLEIARAEAGEHLDAVLRLFKPGAKGTLLVRSPEGESQPGAHDFVITNDDLAEVAAMIDRRRAATKIGSDIPPRAAEVEPPAPCSVIPAGGSATPPVEGLTSGEGEVTGDQRAHLIFNRWDKHPDAPAYWFRLPSWAQDYATECVAATERRLAASPKATATASVREDEAYEQLRHKLWMIACHATGGGIPEIEGIDRSVNDISVQITASRNLVYQAGKDAGRKEALASLTDSGTAATIGGERA